MCNERAVTFFGGVGASKFFDTNGDTVNKNFGPLNVGPGCDWVGWWGTGGIEEALHFIFDVVSDVLEPR